MSICGALVVVVVSSCISDSIGGQMAAGASNVSEIGGLVNNSSHEISTANLSTSALHQRKIVFCTILGTLVVALVAVGALVFLKRQASIQQDPSAQIQHNTSAPIQHDPSAPIQHDPSTYSLIKSDALLEPESNVVEIEGLGRLQDSELDDFVPEDGGHNLAEWTRAKAEKMRAAHETYLSRRRHMIAFLFIVYTASCIVIPIWHAPEASCTQGLLWETHMQFFFIFFITKVIELVLCAADETLEWDQTFVSFMMAFLPSFIGYQDGYGDAVAIVIANSCADPLAKYISIAMAATYFVGVIILQWVVGAVLALQDPSQACLLKLVHMDLLASCVTLPADQQSTWRLLSLARTLGEDIPQAVCQTLYLIYVKRNPFMFFTIMMGVASSIKALYDAWNRHLASTAAAKAFSERTRRLYSCSRDRTIRVWDVETGECIRTIATGEPALSIAVSGNMIYTSHDADENGVCFVHEWSLETGLEARSLTMPGDQGLVLATSTKLYCSTDRGVVREISIEGWECIHEFPSDAFGLPVPMFVMGSSLYAPAPGNGASIAHWSLETKCMTQQLDGHTRGLVALFATKTRLFSGAGDSTIKEWLLESGECMRTFYDHCPRDLVRVCAVRDSLYGVDKSALNANQWSLQTGQVQRKFCGHQNAIATVLVFNDRLYTCADDATIKEWSLETGECLRTFSEHTDQVLHLTFLYDD